MAGRPFALDKIFTSIRSLPGVGPKNVVYFSKLLGGERLKDLLFHKPIDIVDRRATPKISEAPHGKIATLKVEVIKHSQAPNRKVPARVLCKDETGEITLTFFHARGDWL